MPDLKVYRKCREDLLWDALTLVGLIADKLPARVAPGSPLARSFGSQWRSDELRLVASKLEDLTHRFDMMQISLGLGDHPTRFGHEPPADGAPADTPPAKRAAKSKARRPKKSV